MALRNALHRRKHRERAQLAHRAKYGLLEKRKDYRLRARDYHAKQDRLTRLRQKAADRNKDEFYFAMNNERTVQGVHVQDRGNAPMPMDMVKLLKSQDEGYVRTAKTVGLKKIDKIKQQLTAMADLVSAGDDAEMETLRAAGVIAQPARGRPPPKHIVFAQDAAEAQKYLDHTTIADENQIRSTESSSEPDLGWKARDSVKSGRRRKRQAIIPDPPEEVQETNLKDRKRLLKELAARLARDTQLSYALRELEMQRLLVGKGGRKKIRGAELVREENSDGPDDEDDTPRKKSGPAVYKPRVYKWRVERKR